MDTVFDEQAAGYASSSYFSRLLPTVPPFQSRPRDWVTSTCHGNERGVDMAPG